jgi:hypothetical protein
MGCNQLFIWFFESFTQKMIEIMHISDLAGDLKSLHISCPSFIK